jgi:Family of unknown function (DUF5565)
MKKIPTLFQRDPEDMRHLLPEVHPDCDWVLRGEGKATRKFDGTCVQFADGRWWGRREVKAGKPAPMGFVPEQVDDVTGKTVGWEPIEQSPFYKTFRSIDPPPLGINGTYELIGPKINGNPERVGSHRLVFHGGAEEAPVPDVLTFDSLRKWLTGYNWPAGWEGIVWHHPDGRMAKLKVRDFR